MNVSPTRIEIKEHGIYERRDGVIVGPAKGNVFLGKIKGFHIRAPSGDLLFYDPRNGGAALDDGQTFADLIREIVVSEGWLPWNGGDKPVWENAQVDVILRDEIQKQTRGPYPGGGVCWSWQGPPSCNVVAYRVIEPSVTGSSPEPLKTTEAPRRGIPTALERLASMVARLARETAEEAWLDGAAGRLRAIADEADALVAELAAPPARENGA